MNALLRACLWDHLDSFLQGAESFRDFINHARAARLLMLSFVVCRART